MMESNLFVSKYVADQAEGLAALDIFMAVSEMGAEQSKQKSGKRKFSSIQQSTRSFRPFKRTAAQLYNTSKTPKATNSKKKRDLTALESTSAWHAKRMVMGNIAEHPIPLYSSQRGLKAAKRLFAEKSLIQDVSYSLVTCIHVPLEECFRLFASITDPGDALFQMNLMKIPNLEIALFLHKPLQFPLGLIGPCTLSMHQYQADDNGVFMIQVVVWAHPSIHSLILSTLLSTAKTESIPMDSHSREVWAWSRIDLIGHEANLLLGKLMEGSQDNNECLEQCLTDKIKLHNAWRHGYMLSAKLNDPRCLSHNDKHTVRNSADLSGNGTKKASWPSSDDHSSSLWSSPLLQQINNSFESDLIVNRNRQKAHDAEWSDVISLLKSGKQVPSGNTSNNHQQQPINFPIIITRCHKSPHPTSDIHRSSLGGWSIVLPRAYVHTVWQHLIHLGGIACGSAEADFLRRGEGLISYPRDYLDCEAGWLDYVGRLRKVQEKEMKKPPAKRLHWDYNLPLIFFQSADSDNNTNKTRPQIAVVRNPTYLRPFLPPKLAQFGGEAWIQNMQSHSDWQAVEFNSPNEESSEAMSELPPMPVRTYLHVLVEPVGRGQPHSFAAIYRPTTDDIKSFVQHKMQLKMKFQGKTVESKGEQTNSREWHGVELTSESSRLDALGARELLGIITSSDDENGSSDLRAIGICAAERLHETMRCHYMRLGHPCSHQLVLFRNQGSDWLRPAIIRII